VVNIHTGEINFQAPSNWLLLSDEKRAHYMRGDLRRANADFEVHYLPALRPLWLFHVRANPLAEMPKVLER
jgi:hypothetical protein